MATRTRAARAGGFFAPVLFTAGDKTKPMAFSRAAVIAIPPSSSGGGGFQRDVGRRRKRGWDQHQRRCGQAAAVGAALILATYYCAVHAIDAVNSDGVVLVMMR